MLNPDLEIREGGRVGQSSRPLDKGGGGSSVNDKVVSRLSFKTLNKIDISLRQTVDCISVKPPLTATSLQWPLFSVPKVAIVEMFT